MSKYLTEADVAATMRVFYGVPAEWVGEDGDVVALGPMNRRTLAAIHCLGRADVGPVSCDVEDGINEVWARFEATPNDPECPWVVRFCEGSDEGAIRITYAEELSDYTGWRAIAKLARERRAQEESS